MEKKEIRYSNGEVTIVWRPELCAHAGICVKMLPQVYRPQERPWVNMENASSEELRVQVAACSSGALTIREE